MKRFVEGQDRSQLILLPDCLDDYVGEDNPVRVVDAFIDELDLAVLRFNGVMPEVTGRPAYHPSTLLKIYLYGYLNRVQSSRRPLPNRLLCRGNIPSPALSHARQSRRQSRSRCPSVGQWLLLAGMLKWRRHTRLNKKRSRGPANFAPRPRRCLNQVTTVFVLRSAKAPAGRMLDRDNSGRRS